MNQSINSQLQIELKDEAATQRLGELMASHLQKPLTCYLEGDLGVGKTRLVRAIVQSLGYQGNVKSPTYTLVEPYRLQGTNVYHFDLYRLSDPEELDYLGIRDYFDDQSVAFIEWPEKGEGWLAAADISLSLEFFQSGRKCLLEAKSEAGKLLLEKLKQDL